MGAGHAHVLYRPGRTVLHRLPGETKIIGCVGYTIAVVATPREAVAAFAGHVVLAAVICAIAAVPPGWLLRRSLIETPFILLAVLLPFTGGGRHTEWLGLTVSVDGSWAAWNIIVKATLGVWASLLLAATTDVSGLLAGLHRLRCPGVVTQIATFMVRYVTVFADEAGRMRVARLSRGDDPRFLWQLRGFATGVGALFLRAYERGERVYVAMLSRGYTGALPLAADRPAATPRQWTAGAILPAAAAAIATTAILAR